MSYQASINKINRSGKPCQITGVVKDVLQEGSHCYLFSEHIFGDKSNLPCSWLGYTNSEKICLKKKKKKKCVLEYLEERMCTAIMKNSVFIKKNGKITLIRARSRLQSLKIPLLIDDYKFEHITFF